MDYSLGVVYISSTFHEQIFNVVIVINDDDACNNNNVDFVAA